MSDSDTINTHLIFIKDELEEELEKKQALLHALEAELAQQELALITLRTYLVAFERRYMQLIGTLQAKLDELEVKYAELLVERFPQQKRWAAFYQQAQAKAQESAQAANGWGMGGANNPFENTSINQAKRFQPSADLKQTYREIAKRIHPDLAANEKERAFRTSLMIEANIAFQNGDEARLKEVLLHWETHCQAVVGEDNRAKLENFNLRIQRVETRLQAIKKEIDQLMESALYKIYCQVEEAEARGVDLLAAMAEQLENRIHQVQEKIRSLSRSSP